MPCRGFLAGGGALASASVPPTITHPANSAGVAALLAAVLPRLPVLVVHSFTQKILVPVSKGSSSS